MKPAASEMNLDRSSVNCINHEIAGGAVLCPKADSPANFTRADYSKKSAPRHFTFESFGKLHGPEHSEPLRAGTARCPERNRALGRSALAGHYLRDAANKRREDGMGVVIVVTG